MKNLSHSSTWNFTSQSLRTFFPRATRVFHLAKRSTFALSSPPGPVGGGVMGGWRGPLDFLRLRGGMIVYKFQTKSATTRSAAANVPSMCRPIQTITLFTHYEAVDVFII